MVITHDFVEREFSQFSQVGRRFAAADASMTYVAIGEFESVSLIMSLKVDRGVEPDIAPLHMPQRDVQEPKADARPR